MSKDEIEGIRAAFREHTLEQATQLRACLERRDLDDPEVKRFAHNVAGTGVMLGYPELSAAAAAVDKRFAAGERPTLQQLKY